MESCKMESRQEIFHKTNTTQYSRFPTKKKSQGYDFCTVPQTLVVIRQNGLWVGIDHLQIELEN